MWPMAPGMLDCKCRWCQVRLIASAGGAPGSPNRVDLASMFLPFERDKTCNGVESDRLSPVPLSVHPRSAARGGAAARRCENLRLLELFVPPRAREVEGIKFNALSWAVCSHN